MGEFPDHPRGLKHEKTEGVLRNKSQNLEKARGLSITKSQRAHNPPKCFKEGSKGVTQRTFETTLAPRGVAVLTSKVGFQGFLESPKHEKT